MGIRRGNRGRRYHRRHHRRHLIGRRRQRRRQRIRRRARATKPVTLRLVSISPGRRTAANGATGVTVTYNEPLPAYAPMPTLKPAIAGSWARQGNTVVFTPAAGFPAGTKVTVTADAGGKTATTTSSSFTTGNYSTLRLQEILAQLGYLPLTWTPAAGASVPGDNPQAQLAAAYDPPAGTFTWQQGYPSSLHSLWSQGSANTVDTGAITGFEADHGLAITETMSTSLWTALLKAAAADDRNTNGYSYAIADQVLPETLTIWHDGQKRLTTPANTGISVSPTEVGTFPVYEKLPFQIMQGTNPDGSNYADPVEWVSYFNGGDAVHYFPRGSYGWNQSLGCVELPSSSAQEAYDLLPVRDAGHGHRGVTPGGVAQGDLSGPAARPLAGRSAGRAEIGHVGAGRVRGEPLAHERIVAGHQVRGPLAGQLVEQVVRAVHGGQVGDDGERAVALGLGVEVQRVGGQHHGAGLRRRRGDDELPGGVAADLDELDPGRQRELAAEERDPVILARLLELGDLVRLGVRGEVGAGGHRRGPEVVLGLGEHELGVRELADVADVIPVRVRDDDRGDVRRVDAEGGQRLRRASCGAPGRAGRRPPARTRCRRALPGRRAASSRMTQK